MAGLGFLAVLIAIGGLWLARLPGRLERSNRFLRLAVLAVALPFVANLAGWLFTEMGRQPWIVQGLLLTKDAVSPTVGPWSVGLTLVGFTALYGILAAIEAADDRRRPGRARPRRDVHLRLRELVTIQPLSY